tara:strand:+ start:82 stop:456 length:375 start_codon:yes stop_codon:yes gene_type:complete
MAKKKRKKNKLGKILAAGAALAGLGAIMRNRGDRGLKFVGQDMTTGMLPTGDARVAENIALFDKNMSNMAKMNQFGRSGTQGGQENMDFLFMKKGGRVSYGKGGKVSRGCGKVMAGRNKKTKYI